MRKVYIDDLPKGGKGVGKSNINWVKSIGCCINFTYDDIRGNFIILDYDKISRKVKLQYKDTIKSIRTPQLLRGEIGGVLNLIIKEYRYKEEEIIKTITGKIKILKRIKLPHYDMQIKGYQYQCLIDGYIGETTEESLRNGVGCPVCYNLKVLKGVNDIATTHPHLVKYFANIEDCYNYTYGSHKTLNMKCPNCRYEKQMSPYILNKQGFGCNKCSDGVSYPEKFMVNVLEQLNIDYKYQLSKTTFKWCKNYKYDFYIPSINCIIETHGLQHYKDKIKIYGKSAKQEQENDKVKKQFAKNNGIQHYITIDCSYSNLDYIKRSIENSYLSQLLNLNNINWLECHKYACCSFVKQACDLWNSGMKSAQQISDVLKIARNTVVNYLKKGSVLGWCEYDAKEEMRKVSKVAIQSRCKKVEIFKNGVSLGVYDSTKQLVEEYNEIFNIKFVNSQISKVCNNKSNQYKGYFFKFVK